ncbi:hypothetical protein FRC09_016153 [Ceratobasidium sp. 395]|nr:hypothetical protein FRC09_016153 [Ceratobasidium sp. 395]
MPSLPGSHAQYDDLDRPAPPIDRANLVAPTGPEAYTLGQQPAQASAQAIIHEQMEAILPANPEPGLLLVQEPVPEVAFGGALEQVQGAAPGFAPEVAPEFAPIQAVDDPELFGLEKSLWGFEQVGFESDNDDD